MLSDVLAVKDIPAFRTEFRRVLRIVRLPATFVALIKGSALGLFTAAFGAELALVNRTAGAGPTVIGRLG